MKQPDTTDIYLRVGQEGRVPLYATSGSAGCDLFAARALTLLPGETKVLPLDLVMAIEPGVEAQIRPRSGLSLKTELRVPNSPGTIDSDYRSEVGVILQNTFSLDRLADRLIARPELIHDLVRQYRRVSLAEYLQQKLSAAADSESAEQTASVQVFSENWPELAGRTVWLDQQGNPYGTIYIHPGDRVAQMVFSRCLTANFVEHDQPEQIGEDRGGGFGSTGIRH